MRTLYCSAITAMFVFLSLGLKAQEEKWEGGLFLGLSQLYGDVVGPDFYNFTEPNFAYGVNVKRSFTNTLGLRLGLTFGMLEGDDANIDLEPDFQARGFTSKNSIGEGALTLVYEPLGNRRYRGSNFRKLLSPYFFGGLGLAFGNPEPDFSQSPNARGVATDRGVDKSTWLAVPFGGGLRLDLSKKWILGVEVGARPVFDDYLEGISESGNPNENDWYSFTGINLTARFGTADSDGDGIADENDKCPNTPGISATNGCPDTDLDGIEDSRDGCPEVAGDAKFNGCPDSDGDDVADNQDDCPNTPGDRRYRGCPDTDGDNIPDPKDSCPTVAGVPALSGCPDADGDGITDADDACPQLAGIAAANGCPDTDGDGIIDPNDKCPSMPGTDTFSGCPDTDGDGIGDGDDACPSNAGPASNDGCPEVTEADLERLEFAMQNVRFRTSEAVLLESSKTIMNEVAEIMRRYPNYDLKISGYTDNVGNDLANQSLSERRARACFQYLLLKNIDRNRMSHAGYGESNPRASNDTARGRARNRRVEFELILR
ncbi:MAG: DUF6089 family protein [Bacteroidota bacterium]